jgi:CBS domain-containing protein
MPFQVQELIENNPPLVTIQPSDRVQQALALMTESGYSQLPVVDQARRPLGLVTNDSILYALNAFGVTTNQLLVADATTKARIALADSDLFDLLDDLSVVNAVLIVDRANTLKGIVTTFDAMAYFRRRAEDIMLVRDVETMIKEYIQSSFTTPDGEIDHGALRTAITAITATDDKTRKQFQRGLGAYLERATGSAALTKAWVDEIYTQHVASREHDDNRAFDSLTLAHYNNLFLYDKRWPVFSAIFALEPKAIRRLLDSVRQTRNALAHFRDDISPQQRSELRFAVEWLARHQEAVTRAFQPIIPVTEPVISLDVPQDLPPVSVDPDLTTAQEPAQEVVPTEDAITPSESRYALLAIFLQHQRRDTERIQLTFADIERILGGELPLSARQHRAWWANDSVSHVQSQQWLEANWRVVSVNMSEEKVTFARTKEREQLYIAFFSSFLTQLAPLAHFPIKDRSPDGSSWITVAGYPQQSPHDVLFVLSFARNKQVRVEAYIDTGSQDTTKRIFDLLHERRLVIERVLGTTLSWERLDHRQASRIAWYRPGHIMLETKELASVREWAITAINALYDGLREPLAEVVPRAKKPGLISRLFDRGTPHP